MSSVREFGRALTQPFGAPAGPVQTFIEVPFRLGEKQLFPDGLIRVVRGQRQWTALVEVKTGSNELNADPTDGGATSHPHRQAQAEESRASPRAVVRGADHCRHAEGIPRRRRPRSSLGAGRADPMPGTPEAGRPRVQRHGPELGAGPRSGQRGHAATHRRGRPDIAGKPTALIGDSDKELRTFRVAYNAAAGTKRGTGRGAFIDSVLGAIDDFYEQVIQNLKPWMPAPPKMRSAEEAVLAQPVSPSLVSTAISSQDGPQTEQKGEERPDAAGVTVAH
jgi:hypothetical protein